MARLICAKGLAVGVCVMLVWGAGGARGDTVVRFDTSLGSFDVQLYDTAAPITVQNFLKYVGNGLYKDSFIHRSDPGFVVQGGGFICGQTQIESVLTYDAIVNEFDPARSNVRGTIAMAKTSDPNSATSQFFFNLADNSTSLDDPNNSGGFTVFGEVLGDGMAVVDAIAGLDVFSFSSPFGKLPLRDYTWEDYDNQTLVGDDNLVLVDVTVLPEPATLVLLAIGGLGAFRRRPAM